MCHSISSSLVPIVSICAQLVCPSQINPSRHKYRRHEANNGAASWRGCFLSELLLRSERFSPFLALMYLSTKKKKWSWHPVGVFQNKTHVTIHRVCFTAQQRYKRLLNTIVVH